MSLVTVSDKRARVYQRAFDHDEAIALRESDPETWTYAALAEYFGVSSVAVARVLDPDRRERMAAAALEHARGKRKPCKGGCGTLVWTHMKGRSGYCIPCYGKVRAADDVRETELRCTKCREWKPDDEFARGKTRGRRGRRTYCRPCDSAARKAYREANPEKERAAANRAKRKGKPMTTFTVLRRNGAGWEDHAKVDAPTAQAAVEKAADREGEYVAFSAKNVFPMKPVTAFQVVR